MNLLDLILLSVLVGGAIYGSKVGFIRELTGVVALGGAIVIAVHYNDYLTVEMESWLKISPLWASFLAFIFSSALLYAVFKFAARVFYRVAEIQKLGKIDKFGGAAAGVIQGWILAGYVMFMTLYLPLPFALEQKMEESLLTTRMAAIVPFMYESTAKLHPSEQSFALKLEDSLIGAPSSVDNSSKKKPSRRPLNALERARINDFLDRVDRYFFADTW